MSVLGKLESVEQIAMRQSAPKRQAALPVLSRQNAKLHDITWGPAIRPVPYSVLKYWELVGACSVLPIKNTTTK